jgi:hypothetical protein
VPQTVVHQEGEAEAIGLGHGEVERVVIVCPEGALHPVQHMVAAARPRLTWGVHPQVVDHAARAMLPPT